MKNVTNLSTGDKFSGQLERVGSRDRVPSGLDALAFDENTIDSYVCDQ